jgi:hypothetical protein
MRWWALVGKSNNQSLIINNQLLIVNALSRALMTKDFHEIQPPP